MLSKRAGSSPQSSDDTTSQSDFTENGELTVMPILKYSYNKNKGKKPKRNKSAFILFSIETRAKLKKNRAMNSNEMMVQLADMWKNLSSEERERYEREARIDKARYHQELEAFWRDNPSEVLQNKTKKNHVKKPCSAYALFLKEVKDNIKRQQPNLKMADVLKIVSEKWKTLDKALKAKYQDRAEKEKEAARVKLGETFVHLEKNGEAQLRKKRARQQNEIRKQMKADYMQVVSTRSNTSVQQNASPAEPSQVFETVFIPEFVSFEPNPIMFNEPANTNDNEFLEQLQPISDFDAQLDLPPLTLAQISKQPSHPRLETQKSLLTITTNNLFPPEKPKEESDGNYLLKLINKPATTNTDLILDLLNFDSNPLRLDSADLMSKNSLRLNSNPFTSTIDFTGSSFKAYAPRPSRAEILNNAIMSALDMTSLTAQDSKKQDDEHLNSRYFDLSLHK